MTSVLAFLIALAIEVWFAWFVYRLITMPFRPFVYTMEALGDALRNWKTRSIRNLWTDR